VSYAQRQLKTRVLETLERRAKQFRGREELWPLRIPREPLPLAEILDEALGGLSAGASAAERRHFDVNSLRSRTLLHLSWDDPRDEPVTWEAWVIVLPSKLKLFCDTGPDGSHVLASGGKNEGDESARAFLQLLAESAGEHFGIEMSGGAPDRVRSSIDDRSFLVDMFVDLFETTGVEDSVRNAPGPDFRADVERWLAKTLSA
jgi:hypothetical protein